jgi:hypothetical protein
MRHTYPSRQTQPLIVGKFVSICGCTTPDTKSLADCPSQQAEQSDSAAPKLTTFKCPRCRPVLFAVTDITVRKFASKRRTFSETTQCTSLTNRNGCLHSGTDLIRSSVPGASTKSGTPDVTAQSFCDAWIKLSF